MNTQSCKWSVLAMAALLAQGAAAQEKDPRSTTPVAPLPPLAAESSSKAPGPDPRAAALQQEGRSTPVTGIEGGALRGLWSGRSFVVPSLAINFRGDSDSNAGERAEGTVSGRLAFQHLWGRHTLASDYSGATTFDIHRSNRNESYHNWQMSYSTRWRRWSMQVSNAFGYSPEGGIGGGLGNAQLNYGPGGFGNNSLVNLNPFLQQTQTIFAQNSGRISNTVAGQGSVQLSPRTTVTFSGTYGLLRFLDPGFVDNDRYGFQAGYNYAFSPRTTVAVSYSGSMFRFPDNLNNNQSHVLHVTYGRQLTGKLSLRLAAGPDFSVTQVPGAGRVLQTSWSTVSTLYYRTAVLDGSIEYLHGTTGGSGYFRGAKTDELRARFSRAITRRWNGSLNVGFARNEDLVTLASGAAGRRYNSVRGGFQLTRPLNRQATLFLQYGVERQTLRNINCGAGACGFVGTRQSFGLGLNFSFKAIEIE